MAANIDQKTLAYINMYGVLGGLVALCDTVPEARKILGRSGCSVGFAVRGGPQATLTFVGGRCILKEGVEDAAIRRISGIRPSSRRSCAAPVSAAFPITRTFPMSSRGMRPIAAADMIPRWLPKPPAI